MKLRYSKHSHKEYHVQAIEILKENKSKDELSQKLIKVKNRGGLWSMNRDFVNMFGEVEKHFRKVTTGFVTKIDQKAIVESLMSTPLIVAYFKGICRNVETISVNREIADSLLETLLRLYIQVRSFSYANFHGSYQESKIKIIKN